MFSVSRDARDLVEQMLNPIPQDRICIEDALAHPWLASSNKKLGSSERSDRSNKDTTNNSPFSVSDFPDDMETTTKMVRPATAACVIS